MNYKLIIGWLYPELMSTYGDRGNIIVLKKRCEWRGISITIKKLGVGFDEKELLKCDVLFMGGAQDQQQKIVSKDLFGKKKIFKKMIEKGIPGLYICGAYQFLGKYYKEANGGIIKGLDILDLYTENPGANSPRLIGNVAVKLSPDILNTKYIIHNTIVVGFENHGGRTYLGKKVKPLGRVIRGFGNNEDLPAIDSRRRQVQAGDQTEGAVYKNTFGTYLHGPILPKNPEFADLLIKLALEKKYGVLPIIDLSPIDDELEHQSRNAIVQRLDVKL